MKDVVMIQPKNLGDIIFVMSIAQKYAKDGHKVYYPLYDKFLSPSIQKNFPEIHFMKTSDFENYNEIYSSGILEDENHIYLNFVYNFSKNKRYDHMKYKYLDFNFPLEMWRDIKISRDLEVENKLIKFLEIKNNEKFNLINKNYSKAQSKLEIKPYNNYRNIFMSLVKEFNLFDWIGVIERAFTIHTVHTAIHYILDVLPNITNEIHIYPREEILEKHTLYNFLFKKEYIYH